MSANKGHPILKMLLGAYEVAKIKCEIKLNAEHSQTSIRWIWSKTDT